MTALTDGAHAAVDRDEVPTFLDGQMGLPFVFVRPCASSVLGITSRADVVAALFVRMIAAGTAKLVDIDLPDVAKASGMA